MKNKNWFAFLALVLVVCAAQLAACARTPPAEPTAPRPSPSPSEPTHLYTDAQVMDYLQRYPALDAQYEPDPENILELMGIDVNALEQTDRYVGDCICLTVYSLSPRYELVVDENACFGFNVFVREK